MNTTTNSPLVEIVIAAHNAGPLLIESVHSALRQTYPNVAVIVVDDGSTDNSLLPIMDIGDRRLRIVRQSAAGKAVALNRALADSHATFFAIQDADDVSHPQRIERLVDAMQRHSDVAAVLSGHELIINGRRVAPTYRSRSRDQCAADIDAVRLPAHDPTAMFRLSMTRDIAFDPELRIGQGFDHILRVGERFPMLVLGECLYSYRVHHGSITQQQRNRRIDFVLRVIERAGRRRGWPHATLSVRLSAAMRELHRAGPMNNVAAHFMRSVLDQRDGGQRLPPLRTACQCLALHPKSLAHYKPLAYATAPRQLIDWWRRRRHRDSELNTREPIFPTAGTTIECKPAVETSPESTTIQPLTKGHSHV